MELEMWHDPTTRARCGRFIISDNDMIRAMGEMDSIDRYCLSEYNRPGASMEETFMALQLIARKLEEADQRDRISGRGQENG